MKELLNKTLFYPIDILNKVLVPAHWQIVNLDSVRLGLSLLSRFFGLISQSIPVNVTPTLQLGIILGVGIIIMFVIYYFLNSRKMKKLAPTM